MQTSTVLLIILAAIAALLLVFFQYFFRSKAKGRQRLVLSFLRFLALFFSFLLLVNPKFIKKSFSLEKSNLVILVDNSSSIGNSIGKAQASAILDAFRNSDGLNKKFNLNLYKFGKAFGVFDSLDFSDKATDIGKSLKTLNTIYGNSESVVVLLSDGNNTLGEDYEYFGKKQKYPIFPMVLGDTTRYDDLKIAQVNTNKYAFLKNRFPVEVFVSYDGHDAVSTSLNMTLNGEKIHSQKLELSKKDNAASVTVLVNAASVGLKTLRISLDPLKNEKNTTNNVKNVAVEVIDEKTNVAIVTEVLHPDIGVLKKSIESNEQRSVTIVQPTLDLGELSDIDLLILYQPTPSFRNLYDFISNSKMATFTITGSKTNWDFLNTVQSGFSKNSYGQSEEVSPLANNNFSKFSIPDIPFNNYPPLETELGEILIFKNHEVILSQIIKGSDIGEPLLAVMEDNQEREAILFGENLWKWRMQHYRELQNFNDFDLLIGKIVLYLTLNEPRDRLVLNYLSFYESSADAKITANYFDESFSFDPNAEMILQLKPKVGNTTQEFPMLLKGGFYEADMSNMPPGEYTFIVKVVNENLTKSGGFNIMDYDVEQQFTSSNYKKLERLAKGSGGTLFFPTETKDLINDLIDENKFNPIQKSDENVVSLVDFRFLLGIIVLALALEWFIRKYNGLT